MNSRDRFDSLFMYYAQLHGLSWKLLKAQVWIESSFNPRATSSRGAKGLAQFMDPTWGEWGHGDVFNPENSIDAQVRYMAWLLQEFGGDEEKALWSYNFGIGNVRKAVEIPRAVVEYAQKILTLKDSL